MKYDYKAVEAKWQGHGLKRRRKQLVRSIKRTERCRIAPLAQQRPAKAEQQQTCRGRQHDFRVQAQTAETVLVPHVAPHEKAETAEHDERHQRNVHERILRPADERLKRIVRCAHQVKACVAECRNRVEHAHCDSLRETVMRHEPAGQQNRSRPFDDERAEQHAPCQTDNAAAVRQIKPRAHHHALVQRDRSPQDKRRNSRDGHKAESTDLNQQQDDALAEYRPRASKPQCAKMACILSGGADINGKSKAKKFKALY